MSRAVFAPLVIIGDRIDEDREPREGGEKQMSRERKRKGGIEKRMGREKEKRE